MKRSLLFLLFLLLLGLFLTSCGEALPEEERVLLDLSSGDYVLIHPENRRGELRGATLDLVDAAEERGVLLESFACTERENSPREILIGETDRPESAAAMALLGDDDYIITVIGEKLVLYATEDKGYAFAMRWLLNNLDKEIFAVDKELHYQSKIVTERAFDTHVSSGETLTLSFKLLASDSVLTLYLGKEDAAAFNGYAGYSVVITSKTITFYRQGEALSEMAAKNTAVKAGEWYDLTFAFDEEYCTFYFHDDMEGVEPWPEFDLKVGAIDSFRVGMKEESGYGAEVEVLSVKPTEAFPKGGVTYINPIIDSHADPDILYHDGVYYLYATSKEYDVYTSTDLVNWSYQGKSLPGGGWGVDKNYWAPDVEEIDGKFYMAVSFGEDGFGIAIADSPLGPFVCQGDEPLLKKTIDGHIFVDDDGRVYLYYTSWWDGRSYGIYGVEMSDDLVTPKWETERKLITPSAAWEKQMGDIVEAPYMLKKDGTYYLVYSGSHTESPYYAVGYATGKSPIGAFARSADSPILRMTSDVHGTAHCSIVPAPDGSLVIVYHCHNSLTQVHPRHTCIDRIRFAPTRNGKWRLEVWGPTTRETALDFSS